MRISWFTELYRKYIHFEGQSVITHRIFYGVTSGGLLLKLKARNLRGGYLGFEYGVTPLIVPLTGCPEKYEVTSLSEKNVAVEYCQQNGWGVGEEQAVPYTLLRNAPFADSLKEKLCADLVQFVDQKFRELRTVRDYERFCIARYNALTEEQLSRAEEEYPAGYPQIGNMFCGNGGYIYVCAFLGKREEALARIHGERQYQQRVLEHSFSVGFTSPDVYAEESEENKKEYCEIEQALAADDPAACEAVLEQNYQKNRKLLSERFGFSLPESYKELCRAE